MTCEARPVRQNTSNILLCMGTAMLDEHNALQEKFLIGELGSGEEQGGAAANRPQSTHRKAARVAVLHALERA